MLSIMFVQGSVMLFMEGKSVLPMHMAILCEKEVVFIYKKIAKVGLEKMCGTHSNRHSVCYVGMVPIARVTNSCSLKKGPPSRDLSIGMREV